MARWPAGVKNAEGRIDPNVLPEYTLLPASPSQVVSYNEPEAGGDVVSSASNPDAQAPTPTGGAAAESPSILKLLFTGLIALAVPPVFLFLIGLATGAAVLYGCGKILEAVGRALACGPEAVYREWVVRRVQELRRAGAAVSESGAAEEGEQEEIVEGHWQVALEDVEAGQGGPISI